MDLNQRFTDEELLEQLNSSKEGYGNATETSVTSIAEPVSIKNLQLVMKI